jgi:hypothetical protein
MAVVALLALVSILRLLVLGLLPISLSLILYEFELYLLKHNRAVSFLSVTNSLRFGRFTEVKVSCCEVEKGV